MEQSLFENPIYQVSNRYLDVSTQSFATLIEKTGAIEVSYQKFVTDFGPGEFSGYLRVYAPDEILALRSSNLEIIEQGSWQLNKQFTAEMRQAAVVFADTIDSDYFAYVPGIAESIFCFPKHSVDIISIQSDVEALCHWVASSGTVVEQFEAKYYKTFPRAQLRFTEGESTSPHNMDDIRDMLTTLGAPSYYVETESNIESFFRANGIHISYFERGENRQFLIDLDLPAKPEVLKKLSKPIAAIGLCVSEFYELQESDLLKAGFNLV